MKNRVYAILAERNYLKKYKNIPRGSKNSVTLSHQSNLGIISRRQSGSLNARLSSFNNENNMITTFQTNDYPVVSYDTEIRGIGLLPVDFAIATCEIIYKKPFNKAFISG